VDVKRALSTWRGRLAAVGTLFGVMLFLSLFISWGKDRCPDPPCLTLTGWQALAVFDILIALAAGAIVVLGLLVLVRGVATGDILLTLAGLAAVILVAVAPPVERPKPLFDFGIGATFALLFSLVVLAAGAAAWLVRRFEEGEASDGGEDRDGGEGDSSDGDRDG
jgi:hypothetical protein